MNHKKIQLYTDGGARGNPGPAGIGAVLVGTGVTSAREGASPAPTEGEIATISEYIGEATNNQAEYRALIAGLEKAQSIGASEVEVFMDSELIVKQMKREYKVKDAELAKLFTEVYNLTTGFKKVTFSHVRREGNKRADELVNQAIDASGN